MRRQTHGMVLAPLLILALLVCHGLLGAMHQVTPRAAGESDSILGTAHAGMDDASSTSPAQAGTGDGEWDGPGDLASVLLFPAPLMDHTANGESGLAGHVGALMLATAAILWSLFKGMPGWKRVPPFRLVFRGIQLTAPLRPTPSPVTPALQVFRL